jgi:hypothetical protein
LAPDGSLIGISTIHFVRWLLIDEGRRLMMVSDDGSWESYIDEFAELILSGLDAIWKLPTDFLRTAPEICPRSSGFCEAIRNARPRFFTAHVRRRRF